MAGALQGLKVVDVSDESAVYGSRMLASLGAHVTRIEPPGGDPMRSRPPFLRERTGPDRSLFFAYMNAGKRSITLDLDSEDGRMLLARLAGSADVLYFSGEASRFDRLGLQALAHEHPRLIVTAVTPFGLTGPMRSWRGNDLIAWATGGLGFSTGDPDRPPVAPAPAGQLAYVLASYFAAMATATAVFPQRRQGQGRLIDVSLQQSVLAVSGESGTAAFLDDLTPRMRAGSRRPLAGPMGHFPTQDGAVALLAVMAAHWDALSQWMYERTGNESVRDPVFQGPPTSRMEGNRDVVNLFTEEFTQLYTKQELFEEGQRRGITVTPVNEPADVLEDRQLAYRDFWITLEVDGEAVRTPGRPSRNTTTSWEVGPVPRAGEHNTQVYAELGLGPRDLATLRALGVI